MILCKDERIQFYDWNLTLLYSIPLAFTTRDPPVLYQIGDNSLLLEYQSKFEIVKHDRKCVTSRFEKSQSAVMIPTEFGPGVICYLDCEESKVCYMSWSEENDTENRIVRERQVMADLGRDRVDKKVRIKVMEKLVYAYLVDYYHKVETILVTMEEDFFSDLNIS